MSEYNQKTWKDRVSAYPRRRTLTDEDGNEYVYTITRNEGTVTTSGDAFSAANMNDLEGRIAGAVDSKVDSEDVISDYDTVMETELIGTVPDNTVIAQLNENKFDKANLLTTYAEVTAVTEEGTAADCLVIQELISNFQDGCETIANAITEAGVDTATDATPDEMAENILLIPQLGSSDGSGDTYSTTYAEDSTEGIEPLDDGVNFFNSNGKCVITYSWESFMSSTGLPDCPDFEIPSEALQAGMEDGWPEMSGEWNWTREGIESIYNIRQSGRLDVGCCYAPTDGSTYLVLSSAPGDGITIQLIPTEEVTINWGDDSTDTISSGTEVTEITHSYSIVGPVFISISGTFSAGNVASDTSSSSDAFINDTNLQYVLFGTNAAEVDKYCLYGCYGLLNVYAPNGLDFLKQWVFYACYSLKGLIIPKSETETTLGACLFIQNYAISYIIGPENAIGTENSSANFFSSGAGWSCHSLSINISDANAYFYGGETPFRDIYLFGSGTTFSFRNCPCLQHIDGLDIQSSAIISFYNCPSLVSLTNIVDIETGMDFSPLTNLSYESALNIINALADRSDSTTYKTVILPENAYNQLSSDDIAIATAKMWRLTYS